MWKRNTDANKYKTIIASSILYLPSIFPRYDISLLKCLSMMLMRRNIETEKYFVSFPFWEMAALSDNIFLRGEGDADALPV
jgi:hypothetical protein